MPQRMSARRWYSRLAALCVAALALFPASNAGAIISAKPLTSAECLARVNDTPSKLVECIRTADLWKHMQNFQAIADANPSPADGMPSRNSGEPGYKASVDYVASVMEAAGYNVTIQRYTFTYYAYTGRPTLSEVSPISHDYALSAEWNPGQSTGTANNAELQPAGGIIIPPTPTPSSSSGCTAADFTGFVPGRIALIQRGSCFFGVKVLNAQAAGASGVIIFNEGNPGRTGVLAGSLVDANGNPIIPTIPVAFTSFDI
ncbi:MAG TPA: PA domain-containing protein, partial [Chloroflexota bacterium]